MSESVVVINESLQGFPHYCGFCLLCGAELMSRTCHVHDENGMCLSWQDDPECCIPGTQTHNCAEGRLLHNDKEEFKRQRESQPKEDPIEPGPFTVVPADEVRWLAGRVRNIHERDEADQKRITHHWWRMVWDTEKGETYMLPQDIFDRAL
jgi:hypothetical protein